MSQKEMLSQENKKNLPDGQQARGSGCAGECQTGGTSSLNNSLLPFSSQPPDRGMERDDLVSGKQDQPGSTSLSFQRQTALTPQSRTGLAEEGTISSLPHIQRRWPSLGKELFGLEQLFFHTSGAPQHRQATQEQLRQEIIAQLYQAEGQYPRVTRYLAFLLVRYGRGAEIVGNPFCVRKDGSQQALPYTGLEGYYAGSEQSDAYPGLSRCAILQEEAALGVHVVKMLKKNSIEHNDWTEYFHIRATLEGREQRREAIKTIQTLWLTTIGRLRSRVYHNPEFVQTLTEQIEQGEPLCGKTLPGEEGRLLQQTLQEEQKRLKETYAALSEAGRMQEGSERRRREIIRLQRVKALQSFRAETYAILEESNQDSYEVGIQDSSWEKATLLETIVLPRMPPREAYPTVRVHFTPEELDGYLFLALLGLFGADPLARSELVSQGAFE